MFHLFKFHGSTTQILYLENTTEISPLFVVQESHCNYDDVLDTLGLMPHTRSILSNLFLWKQIFSLDPLFACTNIISGEL